MAKNTKQEPTSMRSYWQEQLDKAEQRFSNFITGGDKVVDRYRIEKATSQTDRLKDRYNILYSSTETVKPSLYAQTPKVQVTKRHRDRRNPLVLAAAQMLENTITFALEENDLDEVMNNVVEDYTLPGMGQAWVRYDPTFKNETNSEGQPVLDGEGNPRKLVDKEHVTVDYVYWKDARYGPCRFWRELPWGARRVYMGKPGATKRFGPEKANRLQYTSNNSGANRDRGAIIEDKQAEIWEIWDKTTLKVYWFSADYPDDLLDTRDDPLKLKGFFPFPKPMRAITNTRTFIPRPFYSQYQAQAEELDNLTQRIRWLTEALYVRGVYDQSQTGLDKLLSRDGGNKMIPVENWSQFSAQGGIAGTIQWVPIKEVAEVLMRLYEARTNVKNEIYEITGFSDITRGLSKASETLGAQQIKNDWASARLRIMQKETQRFARDLIRLVGEIQSEHFSVESFALYAGFEAPPPDPNYEQAAQAAQQQGAPPPPDTRQQAVQQFKATVDLLKSERDRCANIGIETDSTILPDEANERKDRMEFLSSIGAFLQQAAPTVQQFPQMGGLLGAIMMFTVRTFRASRPIEEEFEKFQDALSQLGPQQAGGTDEGAAKAQSAVQVTQLKIQAESAKQDKELAFKASEADKDRQLAREQAQYEAEQAAVQLQIKQVELRIKQAELGLKQHQAAQDAIGAAHERQLAENDQAFDHATGAAQMGHDQAMELDDADRSDRQFDASREDAAADRQIQAQQSTENEGGA